MNIEPKFVPLSIYSIQPASSRVYDFRQALEGEMPALSEMRFIADAVFLPSESDSTILSVALCIGGYRMVKDEYVHFLTVSTTTDFVRFDGNWKRLEFPRLLDVELAPFDSALNLAIGLTRGHLMPRFQGSIWPNFVLPSISTKGLIQAMKARDKKLTETADKPSDEASPDRVKEPEG